MTLPKIKLSPSKSRTLRDTKKDNINHRQFEDEMTQIKEEMRNPTHRGVGRNNIVVRPTAPFPQRNVSTGNRSNGYDKAATAYPPTVSPATSAPGMPPPVAPSAPFSNGATTQRLTSSTVHQAAVLASDAAASSSSGGLMYKRSIEYGGNGGDVQVNLWTPPSVPSSVTQQLHPSWNNSGGDSSAFEVGSDVMSPFSGPARAEIASETHPTTVAVTQIMSNNAGGGTTESGNGAGAGTAGEDPYSTNQNLNSLTIEAAAPFDDIPIYAVVAEAVPNDDGNRSDCFTSSQEHLHPLRSRRVMACFLAAFVVILGLIVMVGSQVHAVGKETSVDGQSGIQGGKDTQQEDLYGDEGLYVESEHDDMRHRAGHNNNGREDEDGQHNALVPSGTSTSMPPHEDDDYDYDDDPTTIDFDFGFEPIEDEQNGGEFVENKFDTKSIEFGYGAYGSSGGASGGGSYGTTTGSGNDFSSSCGGSNTVSCVAPPPIAPPGMGIETIGFDPFMKEEELPPNSNPGSGEYVPSLNELSESTTDPPETSTATPWSIWGSWTGSSTTSVATITPWTTSWSFSGNNAPQQSVAQVNSKKRNRNRGEGTQEQANDVPITFEHDDIETERWNSYPHLVTDMDGTNGQAGNMFDIFAKTDIWIHGFTVHTKSLDTIQVDIFAKKGSYQTYETQSDVWTFIGSAEVRGRGLNNPTPLPEGSTQTQFLRANETWAFYVSLTTDDISYSNGKKEGAIYKETPELIMFQGVGKALYWGSTFRPRLWNGALLYSTEAISASSSSTSSTTILSTSAAPEADPTITSTSMTTTSTENPSAQSSTEKSSITSPTAKSATSIVPEGDLTTTSPEMTLTFAEDSSVLPTSEESSMILSTTSSSSGAHEQDATTTSQSVATTSSTLTSAAPENSHTTTSSETTTNVAAKSSTTIQSITSSSLVDQSTNTTTTTPATTTIASAPSISELTLFNTAVNVTEHKKVLKSLHLIDSTAITPADTPTGMPSSRATSTPTEIPTFRPTGVPSAQPTSKPTSIPTPTPTSNPTETPSSQPSSKPTSVPTPISTSNPTEASSSQPSSKPTGLPTILPTHNPTETTGDEKNLRSLPDEPTNVPTAYPTVTDLLRNSTSNTLQEKSDTTAPTPSPSSFDQLRSSSSLPSFSPSDTSSQPSMGRTDDIPERRVLQLLRATEVASSVSILQH